MSADQRKCFREQTEDRARHERGSVTAETALLVPVLVGLVLLAVGSASAGQKSLSLGEGTRIYARELARGTDPQQAESLAAEQSPHSSFSVERGFSMVTVRGERTLTDWLPITLRAEASTPAEEAVAEEEGPTVGGDGEPEESER